MQLEREIDAIAEDRVSGASAILPRALAVLGSALEAGRDTLAGAVRGLCRAQPAMAPIYQACGRALRPDAARALERFAQQTRRAPDALARFAAGGLLAGNAAQEPLRVVTWSASGSVLACLHRVAQRRAVAVACAEGRPMYEGRLAALALSAAGAQVTLFTDAGIAEALADADAVVVGADAVLADWIVNKSGTSLLAAGAQAAGVPVYVLAGREKLLPAPLDRWLTLREGSPREVWPDAPDPVAVRNPYFDRVPLDRVAALVTDAGILAPPLVADALEAVAGQLAMAQLVDILGSGP